MTGTGPTELTGQSDSGCVDAAVLTGTFRRPVVELRFNVSDTHAATGHRLVDWVKSRPDRRWNPDNEYGKCWEVTGFGSSPAVDLAAAGFVDYIVDVPTDADAETVTSMEDVSAPLAELSERNGFAVVWPRLLGYALTKNLIGPACSWAADDRRFEVPLNVFPIKGVITSAEVDAARLDWLHRQGEVDAHASLVATSVGMAAAGRAADALVELAGEVPEWFGLALDDYQVAGATAAAAGHSLIADEMGLGKALANGTPVLTADGWVPIEKLKLGDLVYGPDGTPYPVQGIYAQGQRQLWNVVFDDGSSVLADSEHIWTARLADTSDGWREGKTEALRRIIEHGFNFEIPLVAPIQHGHRHLPMDPYAIGVLLIAGSVGFIAPPSLVSDNPELTTALAAALGPGSKLVPSGTSHTIYTTDPLGRDRLHEFLFQLGMAGDARPRHIPAGCLTSSVSQRKALLAGIMDAAAATTQNYDAHVVVPTLQMADDIAHLVESLGGVVRTTPGPHNRTYVVEVITGFCPYRIDSHVVEWSKNPAQAPTRAITAITEAHVGPATCISVTSPDHLFVTAHHIVTHNTRQALAAAAICGSRRTVISVPPVTISGWIREVDESNLARFATGAYDHRDGTGAGEHDVAPPTINGHPGPGMTIMAGGTTQEKAKKPRGVQYPDGIVVYMAGRREPELPATGVVIVSDSLLSSRPALLDKLKQWRPDVVVVDEAHRAMTWDSKRSKALRSLATSARRLAIPVSGTPFFASVVELAGPLAISGHLDTVFGGRENFRRTFARQNHFNAWVTRKSQLPTLYRALNAQVWVRRTKADVLEDLPPKRRVPLYVDVDLSLFRQAHNEVSDIIDEWIDEWLLDNDGELPTPLDIKTWARGELSLVTRLRRAAGLAKVPVAVDYIKDWVGSHADPEAQSFDRPLIVWGHHKDVMDTLIAETTALFPAARSIVGATPSAVRSETIDAYQAGQVPVLFLSIHAAGVGITLTAGCDALFVETDYTPALVAQAEDRQARRGQTRPVTCTTMIASGTLDERIQGVLNKKFEVIGEVLVGSDTDVAVTDHAADDTTTPANIITDIALDRLGRRKSARHRT